IAAVSGYALGGGFELALACDTIVAAESARFGLPEVQLGIMPGAGGTQRLLRTIGKARAMEIILTGRHITAAEAEAMGLVCRVVPEEECVAAALALARDIAQNAPLAVRLAKRAILHAEDAPLSAGIEYERQLFHLLFASEDQKEGFDAFLNKRKPQWRGRSPAGRNGLEWRCAAALFDGYRRGAGGGRRRFPPCHQPGGEQGTDPGGRGQPGGRGPGRGGGPQGLHRRLGQVRPRGAEPGAAEVFRLDPGEHRRT